MKFDKLNKLKDYDYFEPMAISDENKDRRRRLADLLTDAFLFFFMTFDVHREHKSSLEKPLYEKLLSDKISDAVSQVTGIDGPMSNHIRTLSKEVVDTTFKHVNASQADAKPLDKNDTDSVSLTALKHDSEEPLDSPEISSGSHIAAEEDELISKEDDEVEEIMEQEAVMDYWISINRARLIAQNEANTFLNYTDFVDAKDRGCQQKTWLTMLDNKVRITHDEVEGQTIGIDENFIVGTSEMRFPLDWEFAPDPAEVINCRCSLEYR